MKTEKNNTENILSLFELDILTQNEMNEVRGGSRPKTRDMDQFDEEDE